MTAKDQTSKDDQNKEKKVITVGCSSQKKLMRGLNRVLSFKNPDLIDSDRRIKRKDYIKSDLCSSKASSIGGGNDE